MVCMTLHNKSSKKGHPEAGVGTAATNQHRCFTLGNVYVSLINNAGGGGGGRKMNKRGA